MSEFRLDELLDAMPRIAEAVNRFESPDVQRDAFDALMRAHGDEPPGKPETQADASDKPEDVPDQILPKSKNKSKAAKKPGGAKPSKKKSVPHIPIDDSLETEPAGKTSLPEFVKTKAPKTMQEQSMVTIYWLRVIAQHDLINLSQILTCYKKMGWKMPKQPATQLQQVSSKKKWLDTSDMSNIRLTHAGDQYVEHDLPAKPTN